MIIEFHTLSVCIPLLVGCLCAYAVIYKNLSEWINWFKTPKIITIYAVLACLIVFRKELFSNEIAITLSSYIYSLFFAFIILEQNFSKHSFYKMNNIKSLTALGKYTYGLYAYHIIFISILLNFVSQVFKKIDNYFLYFGCYFVSLLLSIVFSWISYQFMEKNFLTIKEKFYTPR